MSEQARSSPRPAQDKENVTVGDLREKIAKINSDIHRLEAKGYKHTDLQVHIQKLHEYNEIKDIGQMLLGKLACEEGVTTKHLYVRFDLQLDD